MIVPCIDLCGGRAVQLIGGERLAIDGGDPQRWLTRFKMVGEVAVVDLDAARGEGDNTQVIAALVQNAPCRVGGGIRDVASARRWLDLGARKIVLGTAATPELLRQLPRDRVVVALDARHGEVVVDGWRRGTQASIEQRIRELRTYAGGFLVTVVEREGRMLGCDLDLAAQLRAWCGDLPLTFAGGVTTADEIAALDRLGIDAQVGMAIYSGRLELVDAFTAPLVSDRADGLWPTLVCDERNLSLGLAWSNRTSLKCALEERAGVYWSRQRGLWRKGATSGASQELLAVEVDCDRDALRFVVRQAGGFCHRGSRTCFGPARGLAALEATLLARRDAAEPGSYSARLLSDPALLAAKLREEADELANATERGAVVHEAADVFYFTSVRLAQAGVSLCEVEDELDRRSLRVSRRAGDAKPMSATAAATGMPTRVHLRRLDPRRRSHHAPELAADVVARTAEILRAVETEGEPALRRFAERYDGLAPGASLLIGKAECAAALAALPAATHLALSNIKSRVRAFALAQRSSLTEVDIAVPGGRAGHDLVPLQSVGCYAPGGRYPLPSSVLMTALTARVAGVPYVVVASPRPQPITLAAAALADADGLLAVGGAQAIAALAFGVAGPACDMICGPGNVYVAAAKRQLVGRVGIDLFAGPSELVVVADADADPGLIAADMLAQAEHDTDARAVLITDAPALIARVEDELTAQLHDLPTADVARAALERHGGVVVCRSRSEMLSACDDLAPEHVELMVHDPDAARRALQHAGAVFVGPRSAEVFGDYGFGPNHVLPTAGSARASAGLSVLRFLRPRTWLHLGVVDPAAARDAVLLARAEGLEAHARAAQRRL